MLENPQPCYVIKLALERTDKLEWKGVEFGGAPERVSESEWLLWLMGGTVQKRWGWVVTVNVIHKKPTINSEVEEDDEFVTLTPTLRRHKRFTKTLNQTLALRHHVDGPWPQWTWPGWGPPNYRTCWAADSVGPSSWRLSRVLLFNICKGEICVWFPAVGWVFTCRCVILCGGGRYTGWKDRRLSENYALAIPLEWPEYFIHACRNCLASNFV